MKHMNSEIRWAGRTYRAEAGEGDGDGGGGGEGDGDQGGGDKGGDGDGAGDGAGGGDDGAGDGSGGGDDGDGGDKGGEPTWRDRILGEFGEDYAGREGLESRLGRYNDEKSFIEASVQAHDKIRAGELSLGLPENATEEQLNDFRVANGIPLTADKYDFTSLESGRELTEVDLEMMGPVSEVAHKHNISQEVLGELMDTYMAETDKVVEQMHTQDNTDAQEFTRHAKEQWGAEYQINMNRANNQMNLLPEDIRDSVKQARMPDGRALFNSPEFMTWLVGVDRQITPMDPMKGGTEATVKDARKVIEDSKQRMKDDSVGWHKDKEAQAAFMQAQEFIDKFEGSQ